MTTTEQKPWTGIFGGSFNPPHMGHVLACHYALLRWPLKRILVVPSYKHPFGKPLAAFEHRVEMLRRAFTHLGSHVEISTSEGDRGGMSYTYETVQELKRRLPDEELRLIIGSDLEDEFRTWKNSSEIEKLARPLVLPRMMPSGQVTGPIPAVSSSEVRAAIGDEIFVNSVLPQAVIEYIQEHRLYNDINGEHSGE